MAPLLFQREETNEIFRILNFNVFEAEFFSNEFLIGMLCLVFYHLCTFQKKKIQILKVS